MTEIIIRLEDVSRKLWQVLGEYDSWKSDPAKCKTIHQKLLHFNENHSADSDHIDNVIQSLSKGYYLIKSSLEWHEPVVGHNSIDKLSDTHKARGLQWRLVMVYGGFETIIKTLLKPGTTSLKPEQIQLFTDKCTLPNYNSLTPPDSTRVKLEKWLEKPSFTKKSALANFLTLENGDCKIIEDWIVQSNSISTWVDAARLAKALRNATAHGALSASKVNQWGLQKPLLTLSDNLGEIVLAGMQKLI
ncbi:MAG: hypothetical protein ICV78_28855 [Tolypothrix sp. Co-bin9]|nr:hypothetical protein [Tolypothrix sp. Co-bin9]